MNNSIHKIHIIYFVMNSLPSNLLFLLDFLEQLPYKSDSDGDEFEGYLGPTGGSVIIHNIDSS